HANLLDEPKSCSITCKVARWRLTCSPAIEVAPQCEKLLASLRTCSPDPKVARQTQSPTPHTNPAQHPSHSFLPLFHNLPPISIFHPLHTCQFSKSTQPPPPKTPFPPFSTNFTNVRSHSQSPMLKAP